MFFVNILVDFDKVCFAEKAKTKNHEKYENPLKSTFLFGKNFSCIECNQLKPAATLLFPLYPIKPILRAK